MTVVKKKLNLNRSIIKKIKIFFFKLDSLHLLILLNGTKCFIECKLKMRSKLIN